MNGNVGVGTTPSYTLDIKSGGTPLRIGSTHAGYGATMEMDANVYGAGGRRWIVFSSGSTNGTIGGGKFALYDASGISPDSAAYRFLIDTAGNVGIGTTNPIAKLAVSNNGAEGIEINPSGGTSYITSYNRSGGAYAPLYLIGHSGQNLAILSTGISVNNNFGVGTTVPNRNLEIMGAATAAGAGLRLSNVAGSTYFWDIWRDNTTGYLNFGSALGGAISNYMTIKDTGNVGIGTTNPQKPLQVGSGTASGLGAWAKIVSVDANETALAAVSGAQNTTYVYSTTGLNGINAYSYTNSTYLPLTLGWGGANVYIADGGGNVGVGTVAPNDKFSIGNSGAAPAGSSATGHNYTSTYLGTDNYALVNYGLVNTLVNSTNLWSGTKDGTIWNGTAGAGNVGIGTTNPSYGKLQIDGSNGVLIAANVTSGYGGIALDLAGTTKFAIGYAGNASNYGSQTSAGDTAFNTYGANLHLNTGVGNSPTLLFLGANSGNVGIGTTGPAGKLDVVGGDLRIVDAAGYGGFIYGLDANHGIYFREGNSNKLNYYEYGGTLASGSGHKFYTGGLKASQTLKMEIADDGTYIAGPIGIGTLTPAYAIDFAILGDTSQTQKINFAANNGAAETQGSGITWKSQYAGYTKRSAGILQIADGSGYFRSGLAFYTNGTSDQTTDWSERLRISSGGNVGIGTTGPGQKLEVAGNFIVGTDNKIGFRYSPSDANLYNYITGGGGVQPLTLVGGLETGGNVEAIRFETATAGSVKMSILNNGYVGIGLTGPAMPLSVVGSSVGTIRMQTANGTEPYLDIYQASVKQWGIVNPASTNRLSIVEDGSTGTERLTVATGGNVGIGTTNPQYSLDIKSGGTPLRIGSTHTGYGSAIEMDANVWGAGGRRWIIMSSGSTNGTVGGGKFGFYDASGISPDSAAYRFLIDTNGNVGIGTTNPTSRLTVASDVTNYLGQIVAQSTSATNASYAGFVGIGTNSRGLYMTMGDNSLSSWYGAHAGDGTIATTANAKLHLRAGAVDTGGITIATDGKVGVGTTGPGYALDVNGDVRAVSFIYSSDRNLKQNIATIQSPLEKITQLRGVTFNWKKDNKPSMGLIAQEVEQVFPELVTGQEGSKAVQYGNLVAPLIEAVKAQQTEIKNNNEEIAKLKAQQAEMINRLKSLEVKSKKK